MHPDLHPSLPRPALDAPAGAWSAFRAAQRAADRRAGRERRGRHPILLRMPGLDLAALEAAAVARAGEVLKPGPGAWVLRLPLPTGQPVVLKHYPPTRRLDPRDAFGRSKAVRSLLAAEALARRGFHVARPLAAWSRPGRGSWLLLEDCAGAEPLHEAITRVEGRERAHLLAAFAREVRLLHAAGVAYRDLKPSNVLVRASASGPVFLFLDHDRNWFLPVATPLRLARRDLAAIHAGLPPAVRATERLLALRAYCAEWSAPPLWRRAVRPLLREAAARAHRWAPRRLLAGA